jgi:hypothetical protein
MSAVSSARMASNDSSDMTTVVRCCGWAQFPVDIIVAALDVDKGKESNGFRRLSIKRDVIVDDILIPERY